MQGMKPYVLSEKSQEKYGSGWRQCGTDTSYLNTPLRYNQQESIDEDSDEDMYTNCNARQIQTQLCILIHLRLRNRLRHHFLRLLHTLYIQQAQQVCA